MLNTIAAAIYSRLASDAPLDLLLARSVIAPVTLPAVYQGVPVPITAALPYVVISGPVVEGPVDTFDAEYRASLYDIHAYDSRPDSGGGSVARVNNIAERVRALLHRKPLTLTDGPRNLICLVSSTRILDDQQAFGRIISVQLYVAA